MVLFVCTYRWTVPCNSICCFNRALRWLSHNNCAALARSFDEDPRIISSAVGPQRLQTLLQRRRDHLGSENDCLMGLFLRT